MPRAIARWKALWHVQLGDRDAARRYRPSLGAERSRYFPRRFLVDGWSFDPLVPGSSPGRPTKKSTKPGAPPKPGDAWRRPATSDRRREAGSHRMFRVDSLASATRSVNSRRLRRAAGPEARGGRRRIGDAETYSTLLGASARIPSQATRRTIASLLAPLGLCQAEAGGGEKPTFEPPLLPPSETESKPPTSSRLNRGTPSGVERPESASSGSPPQPRRRKQAAPWSCCVGGSVTLTKRNHEGRMGCCCRAPRYEAVAFERTPD
jgi:hypothetical protein